MLLKEKLTEALAKKDNDINTFVWKGRKVEKNNQYVQEERKMIDCSIEELKSFYRHCESMLNNNNIEKPGRRLLLNIIAEQRAKCNTELFLRWMEQENDTKRYVFLSSLRECLNKNPQIDPKNTPIEIVVGGCPKEFKDIKIDMVLNGCLDTLGKFNKQHITLTFLLKQGLWFSPEESKMLARENITEKLEYAKKYLELKPNANLKINSKGLSLAQLQAMVTLKSKKYSELTILQLETLRNRILFSLENEVNFHIQQWENREHQIKLVLQSKGVEV